MKISSKLFCMPFPSSKIAALKWKEKCKASSCLPVIHQDCCFKVQRKVLLCFARLNPKYAAKVKEEIDKLLQVGFIRPVKRTTLLSPIVVVPKKNGKL
jgi:hypothetical protein